MAEKRHQYKVGDRVAVINVREFSGRRGKIIKVKGFFTRRYVVKLDSGAITNAMLPRFISMDKR